MRPWGHSEMKFVAFIAAVLMAPLAGTGQQDLRREGDSWVRTYTGVLPPCTRLRINGHGPVSLEAGGKNLSYSVRVSVAARTQAEARRLLERLPVRVVTQGEWVVLTAPGGPA